ncbi:MAG: UvrD-helicase domain-containing protein [Anaerolineae bacterium]
MSLTSTPTYGEKLLNKLLRDLPRKQFFFQYEPQIAMPDGHSSKPDFVIVSALLGVVVLEVKDWVKLEGGDQQSILTTRSNGSAMTHANPLRIAEGYAYDLKRRFEARAELWEQYKGRKCLRFPWQVMVALPRISHKVVEQFEAKGIWPRGVVLGKERLKNSAQLQQAIYDLPWKFKLEQPLSLDILDIVREILNPSLLVENNDGLPIGTLTQLQHGLISEPLHAVHPKQLALFDYDELSDETQDLPGSAAVRLVRGVAGSGKTLVLIRRARHLAEKYPKARLLILTFNVELGRDLKTRLRLPEERVLVANFHRVCRMILGEQWREPLKARDWLQAEARDTLKELGFSSSFVADEFGWRKEMGLLDDQPYLEADRSGRGQRLERSKREVINDLFNRYRAYQLEQGEAGYDWDDVPMLALEAINDSQSGWRQRYDAILIDEAQDFAPSWIRLALTLLKPKGDILLCDDPSQTIFCAYTWPQKGLAVVGRTRILRVPFRSTREISRVAHSLIEADETLRTAEERAEPDFSSYELSSGPLPALMACPDGKTEGVFIEDKIKELLAAGVAARQIAILCHAKWQIKRWSRWHEQGVYVQYFEKMKGLEFMVVFVPHLHDAFPHPDDAEAVTAARRKLFTAMTRARYRLILSYQGALPQPLEPLLEHMWCESVEAGG